MTLTGTFRLKNGKRRLFSIKICTTCKKAGKMENSERDMKDADRPNFTFKKNQFLPTVYHQVTEEGNSMGFQCYECIEKMHLIGPEEVGSNSKGL